MNLRTTLIHKTRIRKIYTIILPISLPNSTHTNFSKNAQTAIKLIFAVAEGYLRIPANKGQVCHKAEK